MFFAHMPAGYLLSRGLLALMPGEKSAVAERRLLAAGMLASVLPDFDLLYFYLWSDQTVGHRAYWTHAPLFWLCLGPVAALVATLLRKPGWHPINAFVLANVLLHLLLDTFAGPVRWPYPFSAEYVQLFDVPRGQGWWVSSYLAHWSIGVEAAITFAAAWVALRFPERREASMQLVRIAPYSLKR